jgi:Na+/H+-dicarboxylate symporter
MKNLALHWKIIIGMLLGVIYGISAHSLGFNDFTT